MTEKRLKKETTQKEKCEYVFCSATGPDRYEPRDIGKVDRECIFCPEFGTLCNGALKCPSNSNCSER